MIPNMKEMFCTLTKPASVATAALLLAGCASTGVKNPRGVPVTEMRPDERGFVAGTGTESTDIVTVTDKIAREILSIPQIANAQGTPRVVLDPVKNNTRFPINKEIFLTRIRTQLNQNARGKVLFLARDRMAALERERQLKQTGQVTSSSDPNVQEFKGADFFLTGELQGHTTRTSQGVSDYVIYAFQLVDARTSDIIYEGSHEIKKQGLEDAAYR
jgi:penicillin-binding protein activator